MNTKTHSASASIVVHAPREKVWEALTEPELVRKYFFGSTLKADWRIGGSLTWSGEYEGKTYEDRGTVLSFDPPESLSFNYWSSFSGTEDTVERRQIVRYDLEQLADGVRLTITQSNVDTEERAKHSAENWKVVLAGLKELVESGAN